MEEMKNISKKNEVVSVIIPVFNLESYIERCLRSVTGQSYQALEILVIDDGSTDRSAQIVERLAGQDDRIRLIRQENAGVGAARNRGIEAATGRYLTFVDGDDYLSRNYIRRYVARMKQTGASLLIGGIDFVTEEGKVISRLTPDRYIRFEHEEWPMRIAAVCSHFYLRELWTESGMRFSETRERGEDFPIALYFAATCSRIDVLESSGYHYVQRRSSATHLEEAVLKIRKDGIVNSRQFHEVFVLRMLAMCAFDLARGASRDKKKELCAYISRILKTYYPSCSANLKVRLFSDTWFPFTQKAAVWLLVKLVHCRLLYPVIRFI